MPMTPIDLIKQHLGPDEWERCRQGPADEQVARLDERAPAFPSFNIYLVYGFAGQFDFPCLPGGCYAVYAASNRAAIRLTRAGKEIEKVLATDWRVLPTLDAAR